MRKVCLISLMPFSKIIPPKLRFRKAWTVIGKQTVFVEKFGYITAEERGKIVCIDAVTLLVRAKDLLQVVNSPVSIRSRI
jgi:hypothetical protein